MRKVTRTAPAKINLGLDVTGTRPDGYHLLETVFQAVSIADTVTVELTDTPDIALTCDVAGVPCSPKNIAWKAAQRYLDAAGLTDGVQIHIEKRIPMEAGMGGGSSLDLGVCPLTVFVLLQLPAERGGGLVQVRNCGIQILDGVQRMGFQIVHRPFDFLKVPDSAFQFCLARPIAALLVAEVEVVHQQVGQRGFFRLFQSVQKKLLLFVQVCDPALQTTDGAADGLHQAVGGSNVPVQDAEKGFHSALFHLVRSRAEMHGRYLLDALPLKGAQVNTFWSASGFQIAVGDGLPAMPPDLGVLLVVPVHNVFFVALPVAGREPDALTVLVKVINLSGFRQPLAVFVHCPDGQQNVGVWVSISLVVDGKIGNHALGNKLLVAKFFEHGKILFLRHLYRERQHDAPGKLGVPLVLYGFHGVPKRCPVCISRRCMGWQHDFSVDKFFLLVVEFRFLVVLAEQPFAALVSGPGNSGLPLAALDDGNFEMRTRNRHHPQTKRPPSKIALDERSGIVFGYARRLGPECHALRS